MTSALPQQFDTFLECKREAATASKEGLTPLCWCDVVLAPLGGAVPLASSSSSSKKAPFKASLDASLALERLAATADVAIVLLPLKEDGEPDLSEGVIEGAVAGDMGV